MPKQKKFEEFTEEEILEAVNGLTDYVEEERNELVKSQFVKGRSGNPGGRPSVPDLSLDELILWKLGRTRMANLAEALIKLATGDPKSREKPDLKAIIYLCDRIAGKPRQQIVEVVTQEEPLVVLLKELHAGEEKSTARRRIPQRTDGEHESAIEGEVREIDSEEDGA